MTIIRSLIASGDLPKVTTELGEQKCAEYQRAISHGSDNKIRKIAALFSKEVETDICKGINFIHGLVGGAYAGARVLVYAIARIHKIAILDLTEMTPRALDSLTMQQIVEYILDTPPRCAILVHLSSGNERMHKVMKRLAMQELKSTHRRVVFCLTRDDTTLPTGTRREYFPGTVEDRISMLLYLVPLAFVDADRLRIIAEKMVDYTVFQPKILRLVNTGATIDDYYSSLNYQVIKTNSVCVDEPLDDFPSFEVPWRKSMSASLGTLLVPSPEMKSSGIHRVIPIGVNKQDAIRCFQSAIPTNIVSPYLLTVESQAIEDKCGSIAITQAKAHIVIHMHCKVDPGIMTEVCRELRVGHRAVVLEMTRTKVDTDKKLTSLHGDVKSLHDEMCIIKELLKADRKRPRVEDMEGLIQICKKKTCLNPVTERFGNGLFKKQCVSCNQQSNLWKETIPC